MPSVTSRRPGPDYRPVWAEVDLDAIRHNTALLADQAGPARLMAVVKADGYGHGAVAVALAALESGATWLGVALVEEGVELREAGIDAPILLLSEPPPRAARAVVDWKLTPVLYSRRAIDAVAKAVADAGMMDPVNVHLKIDTGMHRVGCEPERALELARLIRKHRELRLEGLMTHFAVADEPENPFTATQISRFEGVRSTLSRAGIRPPVVHASNSAGLLSGVRARFALVRCGIALYGIAPSSALDGVIPLRPAFSLRAQASLVRRLDAGERCSYGLRYEYSEPSTQVTVPIGYADGLPRRLGDTGGQVLIGGRRHPIAGTVTMDQILVDLGSATAKLGEDVVLIGRQGDEEITAAEWAARLGSIPYEIVCGVGPRVPRRYLGA